MAVKEVILNFTKGENEGVELKLSPPRTIRFGRSEESDVFLGEKKISRKHCILHLGEEALSITDLDSTNGTFVNGKRISDTILEDQDQLRVGSSTILVKIVFDEQDSEQPTQSISEGLDELDQPPKRETSSSQHFEDVDQEEVEEEDSDMVVEYQSASKPKADQKASPKKPKMEVAIDDPSDDSSSEEEPDLEFDLHDEDEISDAQELDSDHDSDAATKVGTSSDVSDYQEDLEPSETGLSKPMTSDEVDFDKIPEIEEISEDLDQEIEFISEDSASSGADKKPDQKASHKKAKPLTGDLSAMGLADLLQNLNQNLKTGRLSVETDQQTGEITFLKGQLHTATVGKATGSKAIYRMLGWEEGEFTFNALEPKDKTFKDDIEPIAETVDGLLMEGMRQLDESRKIKDVLPPMDQKLGLNTQIEVPLSKLHPKVLDIVQLIINHGTMGDVMDLSSLSDLETAKIVFYLLKKKMVVPK
jgi:pSer/pThr/pTyr-binding forkhead associated (FHA) protein